MPKSALFKLSAGSTVAIALAAGLSWLATTLIYANVVEGIADESVPLPVEVVTFTSEDSYLRTGSFMGVVRAANDSIVGFEVAGTINTMAAREGQHVQAGTPLAALDTDRRQAQLRAAEAELNRLESQLELAQLQFKRVTDIEQRGLASQQELDEARLNANALLASKTAMHARLDSAKLEIEKSTLLAPFDGVVAERLAHEGAVVNAGSPVLRLVASSAFEAHIGVPSEVGATLQVGKNYRLTVAGAQVSARLRAIRNDVDAATLTVGAVLELPPETRLNAGENVVLELEEAVSAHGGWVPMSALIAGDRGLWNVLVVEERDGHAIALRESVEVVYNREDRAFVRGTLRENALVIATGLQRLSPGSRVEPLPSQTTRGAQ